MCVAMLPIVAKRHGETTAAGTYPKALSKDAWKERHLGYESRRTSNALTRRSVRSLREGATAWPENAFCPPRNSLEERDGSFLERFPRVRRSTDDAPTNHLARISWMLVALLCDGVVEYGACVSRFGISRREFQRDLRKLRKIGQNHGFTVTRTKNGRVFLHSGQRRISRLDGRSRDVMETLSRIASARPKGAPPLTMRRYRATHYILKNG